MSSDLRSRWQWMAKNVCVAIGMIEDPSTRATVEWSNDWKTALFGMEAEAVPQNLQRATRRKTRPNNENLQKKKQGPILHAVSANENLQKEKQGPILHAISANTPGALKWTKVPNQMCSREMNVWAGRLYSCKGLMGGSWWIVALFQASRSLRNIILTNRRSKQASATA